MGTQFVITQAGLNAVNTAKSNGPLVEIESFAVGSAYNYTPDGDVDESLRGTQLYPVGIQVAKPSNYFVTPGQNGGSVATLSLVMDDTVGDFNFGEVALYLPGGVMFALMSYPYLQAKIQSTPSAPGNTFELIVPIPLDTIQPIIDFSTFTGEVSTLADYGTFDMLEAPSGAAVNNARILTLDEYQRAPMVIEVDDDRWYSMMHDRLVYSGTVTDTSSRYALRDSALGREFVDSQFVKAGRYLVRFTGGTLNGRVREVIATPAFAASTVYEAGQFVRPAAPNGLGYRVSTAGTSGGSAPAWPTTPGATVVSGSVTFTAVEMDGDGYLSWAGSTGTAPAIGAAYQVFRASSFTDFDRYILEFQIKRTGRSFFNAHH